MLVLAISCHRFLWFFAARADNANYGNDYQQGDTPSYRAYYDNHCKIKYRISCWIQKCSQQHLFERIFVHLRQSIRNSTVILRMSSLLSLVLKNGKELVKLIIKVHDKWCKKIKKEDSYRTIILYGSVLKTYVVGIRSQVWSELHT